MRVLAWNVAHQSRRKRTFPMSVGSNLAKLSPDVIVLSEYVANPSQNHFRQELTDSGYHFLVATEYVDGENQVLVAARNPLAIGDIRGPMISPATRPNWLHVKISSIPLDLVGLRVPMFEIKGGSRLYWDWLEATLPSLSVKPTMLIGDLNVKPERTRSVGGRHLTRLVAQGWTVVTPQTGCSYFGSGEYTSRLDHALLSPGLVCRNAEYVCDIGELKLAGPLKSGYSDHAALVVDADLAQAS